MANFIVPELQPTFLIPGSNTPGNGVQLFIYTNLSTTKTTSYKSISGAAHTNPIVLDSGGNLPTQSQVWIPSGVTITAVYAPANDTDPPQNPYVTWNDLVGVNDISATASQWVVGPTPTFVSGTSFTLTGDQTADFHIGRRLFTQNTGGAVYGRISNVSFAGVTTVTVVNDSGALDSGLSAVFIGLLTATNPAVPLLTDAFPDAMNATDKSKLHQLDLSAVLTSTTVTERVPFYSYKPATQVRSTTDVVSGSTTNVSSVAGSFADLNGTNAINQFTMFDGQSMTLRATSTTPLNNSTTFVILGGGNITTSPGDFFTIKGYAPPLVRMENYSYATTQSLGLVKLQSGAVANSSNVDIVMTQFSSFPNKLLKLKNFAPVNASAGFQMRFSNNGVSYDASANYRYAETGLGSGGGGSDLFSTTINQIEMSGQTGVGTAANGAITGNVQFFDMNSTTFQQRAMFEMSLAVGNQVVDIHGSGIWVTSAPIQAARLLFAGTNISSGAYDLYGYV